MFDDIDITPQKQPKKPRDLSGFSVDDLNNYIAALTDEIARAENERTRKKAYLEGAASLFKKTWKQKLSSPRRRGSSKIEPE